MDKPVRVRFAPSPTGFLHIGGARTALYNWLFARHHGGTFILRIEDTDRERSTDESIASIMAGMQWLNLDWDEGPFRQTERYGLYNEHVDRLLAQGKAYRCFCTPGELETRRAEAMARGLPPKYDGRCRRLKEGEREGPCAIRFKAPQEGSIAVDDLIRGPVMFDATQMDDLIIRRSDGNPTYNLTVVVDDALMKVTHVIRGEDHLSNTPRQIQLYQDLGYDVPRFGHMPMILGPDKSKLSKRHGAVTTVAYRDLGFLWEAMVNYIARLGWAHGDQEIFTREELIRHFAIEKVNKSPAVFDVEKLRWVNAHWMKALPPEEIARRLVPHLGKRVGTDHPLLADLPWLAKAVITLRERSPTLEDMAEMGLFYFLPDDTLSRPRPAFAKASPSAEATGGKSAGLPAEVSAKESPSPSPTPDWKAVDEFIKPETKPLLEKSLAALEGVSGFTHDPLQKAVTDLLEKEGIKLKAVAQPLRAALTFRKVSPGLFEVMEVLGKERTLARIRAAMVTK